MSSDMKVMVSMLLIFVVMVDSIPMVIEVH